MEAMLVSFFFLLPRAHTQAGPYVEHVGKAKRPPAPSLLPSPGHQGGYKPVEGGSILDNHQTIPGEPLGGQFGIMKGDLPGTAGGGGGRGGGVGSGGGGGSGAGGGEERSQRCKSQQPASVDSLPVWPKIEGGYLGNFTRAAVASDHGICSEIGRNILIRGGNAVDSAIAIVLCIGVLVTHSSGLGGGHFMTIYNRTTQACFAVDAREQAPLAAKPDMYVNDSRLSEIGWQAIGVPGEIYGLYTAYELRGSGRIPWKDLVIPAADLCRYGHPVSGALAEKIAEEEKDIMKEDTLRSIFLNNKTGRLYKEGEIMRRPVLASTLYELAHAQDPIQWFYNSSKTNEIADEFQKNGGIITADDFRHYKAKFGDERPVVTLKIGEGLVACGPPPPSSASVIMAILNILQGYDINRSKLEDFEYQLETYHRLLESMKFAYGARMELGDMDFVKDALKIAENLTTPSYGTFIRSRITKKAHLGISYYQDPGHDVPKDHGTSHISVLDEDGNAVAITTSINFYFGARVRSRLTGIIWNDQMDDFSNPGSSKHSGVPPPVANFIAPGKRPMSAMSPIVVYNTTSGDVGIVAGSAGGIRIITAIAQLLMRLLWFGQNPKEAIESPRLHHQLTPFQAEFEPGFPEAYLQKLVEKGHNFTTIGSFSAASTAIHRGTDGRVYGCSDYRKPGGYACGY